MNENTEEIIEESKEKPGPKPNEIGGFYFSSSIKIFDPNSEEILVQKRGDN